MSESFSDGNFTSSPAWSGSTSAWQIVANSEVSTGATGSNTLRLSASSGSGTEYLSTQIPGTWGTQQVWGFWIGRRAQEVTVQNRSYVWLYASEADINSNTVDGYRIRFGNNSTEDKIVLESVTDAVPTVILTSGGGTAGGITDFGFLVRVTRSSDGLWSLFTSDLPTENGAGAIATDIPNATNANVAQGTVTNTDYTTFDDGYIAFAALHSTGAPARAGAEFDQLQFSFVAGSTLPVKFSNLDARLVSGSVSIKWNVGVEEDLHGYNIERSNDGRTFTNIGFVNANGESSYSFVDSKPSPISYYRVKSVDISGKYGYSSIALVKSGKSSIVLKAFPTPFVRSVSIQHPTAVPGSSITVSSADGRVIRTIVPATGMQQSDIDLSAAKPGFYVVRFSAANGESETLKILKQ